MDRRVWANTVDLVRGGRREKGENFDPDSVALRLTHLHHLHHLHQFTYSTYSTMSSKKAVQESRVSAEAAARLIAKDRRLLRLTPENVMMAAITFICTVFGLHIFAKIVS